VPATLIGLAPSHQRVRRVAGAALALAVLVPGVTPGQTTAASPTLAQLVGQKLMVAMAGTTPDADLLGRVSRGEVGGVILFGSNVTSAGQLAALTAKLRSAAAGGGQPPVLIATDQEGGAIRRLPWAPPTVSPPQMGAAGSATTATSQGSATGNALACAGVNNDLAPVADVPASADSFMYRQGRTWSFSATTTSTLANAFAAGLQAGLALPAMKHFPGIGFATANTDTNVVTITASKAALAPGLVPYQAAIAAHVPLIMLSNATYTAYDSANAAGWSSAISGGLLRDTLGFTGVTITDSLDGTAAARGVSEASLAERAALAGTDMLLLSGSEATTKSTYRTLLLDAQSGVIPTATLEASYTRILSMKAHLPAPITDTLAPASAAPASRLFALTSLGTTTTPVRTSWHASDRCGISGYVLERRTSGGAWTPQRPSTAWSTSAAQPLTFGARYRYAVRATDGAGNTGGWAYGPFFVALLTQQSGAGTSYRGRWVVVANAYASGGSLAYSTTAGASATFAFSGSSVSWVAYRGPSRGSAAVYVDGAYRATVNLHATTYHARQVVFAASWPTSGRHSIRVVNLGTAGHSRVDVDAFVRLVAE